MNPLDHLATTLANEEITQAQREALIDIAVWAMYVDGAIKHEENEQVDEVIQSLDNAAAIPLSQYLYTSIAKVRKGWNDQEGSEVLLKNISDRLESPEMKRTAFALCEGVTHADDDLADTEQAFLDRVRQHFDL